MSKLSAYNFYQNTTSPVASKPAAGSVAGKPTAGVTPAAVLDISDAARQAAGQSKAFPSTNTIWGSSPHQ